ncbi:MAG TPA: squalene/phytoene synthase family protein [Steroidobacteraceae bacterium]|jgi:phytoene synthase
MPQPELSAIRSLAWLYSSAPQRRAITALTALEREIAASLRPGLDHQVAHTRLAWWREECVRAAQGQPRHPLTCELGALFAPLGAGPLEGLAGLVDLTLWDLSCATFNTRRELDAYCKRWSATVIAPLARMALSEQTAAHEPAFGANLREIEMLLALASDARAGRLRLPLDELERARVSPESLARPPWTPELAALLQDRHQSLRAALGAAIASLAPEVRRPLRGLLVWATMSCLASQRAQSRLPRESSPPEQHAPLDGWRAWRAARRIDRIPRKVARGAR